MHISFEIETYFNKEYNILILHINGGTIRIRVSGDKEKPKQQLINELRKVYQKLQFEVAERKKVEEELQKKNRQQEAILNNIPDIAWLKDTESRFIATNEPFAKACGISREELVGKNDLDIWPHDLAERYRADDKEVMATGRQKQVEEPLENSERNKTWIETIKTPIYNNEGEVIGTTGIARDVTNRKLMEEKLHRAHDELEIRVQERTAELEESEEKYRALINDASDAILVADDKGNLLEVNKKAEDLLGYTREELSNMNMTQIHPDEELERTISAFKEIAKKGSGSLIDAQLLRKDRKTVFVDITASTIKYSGKKIMQGIFRDITDRKKAEELHFENLRLEAADKAKSEFLANMSHELRTPLNASIGFSELLKMGMGGKLTEKQEKYVDNILTSNQFLLSLINDILDLSKIEAGKIELVFDKMSVPVTIKETLSLIKEKAMKHNVLLKTEFDPELECIEADKQRFKQILFNLLSNAVKFSKEEGGTVTITAKKEGDMAQISVSDTGIGIKKENLSKLFNKFEQLESGITEKYGGTGLGLAITKQLVELHGGAITAVSIYGEGSTFTFTLPIEEKER